MYYTEFGWLDEADIAEVLPEDGVPTSQHIDDLDAETEAPSLTNKSFQDWIWEGRHDCDVAAAILRMWVGALRASGNDTIADVFVQLREEYLEGLGDEERCAAAGSHDVPVTFIAHVLQRYGQFPFVIRQLAAEEVRDELRCRILEELASVQAYMSTWTGTSAEP